MTMLFGFISGILAVFNFSSLHYAFSNLKYLLFSYSYIVLFDRNNRKIRKARIYTELFFHFKDV